MTTLNGMKATFKKIPETTHKALIDGVDVIPFAAPDGTFFYISRDELFNQLGGITSGFVGVIDTTDILGDDGIYIPETSGIYNNAGGLVIDTSEGLNLIVKSGGTYQKAIIPVPVPENKIPQWAVGSYEQGSQVLNGGSVWESTVNTSQEPNGATDDWQRVVWGSTGNIFMGQVTPSSPLNTDGIYIPVESGSYDNAGGIDVDVTDGFTVIVKNGENYDKIVYPVSQPLVKDSIDNLKNISGDELMRLQSGFYKYAQLQGFYDSRGYNQPINYDWVPDSTATDDGGSVIQVEGVATGRFVHDFNGGKVNAKIFGAIGDGVTDDTQSLQRCLDVCSQQGLTAYIPAGEYLISDTVFINGNLDSDQNAVFLTPPNFTGVAVFVGPEKDLLSTVSISRIRVTLPSVVNSKTGTGWSSVAGSIGIQLHNLFESDVTINRVFDFETGVLTLGNGEGNSYNKYSIYRITQCNVLLECRNNNGGWCNENTFYGGRLAFNSSEGNRVAGTKMIWLHKGDSSPQNGPNNNRFIGQSLEGVVDEYCVYIEERCSFNYFYSARYEAAGQPGKSIYVDSANGGNGNTFFGGYGLQQVARVEVNGFTTAFYSELLRLTSSGTTATLSLANRSSASNAVLRAFTPGADFADNSKYSAMLSAALGLELKQTDDVESRIMVHPSGYILMGDGDAAKNIRLTKVTGNNTARFDNAGTGGVILEINEPSAASVGGAVQSGLSLMNTSGAKYLLWADSNGGIRASNSLSSELGGDMLQTSKSGATASRPSSPVTGQMFFDTDLTKPIWYSGSGWVDATGTAV